jgi:hypothetical protein
MEESTTSGLIAVHNNQQHEFGAHVPESTFEAVNKPKKKSPTEEPCNQIETTVDSRRDAMLLI